MTENFEDKRFLIISDLHIFNTRDIATLNNIIEKIDNESYDAILIVGDIIDSTNVLHDNLTVKTQTLEFISILGQILPTYIVYASHDLGFLRYDTKTWMADEETFKYQFLNQVTKYSGVHILDNEIKNIGKGYTLSGYNPSLQYAMEKPDGDKKELLESGSQHQFIRSLDDNNINILLCHYPNAVIQMNNEGLLNNIDLAISGHNHNGCTQFKYLPIEFILDKLGFYNRGIITPGKSIKLEDTKNLRGIVELNETSNLLINPSIKTFAACTGSLGKLDRLFYKGMTEVEFVKTLKRR